MKLAEKHIRREGLADRLLDKDTRFIRPKETDLIALLETGTIDYIFLYRSVASQHGLLFITLPDVINLKNPGYSERYGTVSVEISGKRPGEKIVKRGAPIVYGITIPSNSPSPGLAGRCRRISKCKWGGLRGRPILPKRSPRATQSPTCSRTLDGWRWPYIERMVLPSASTWRRITTP